MKSNNGVTLVALVVTIIVLIILAGISINLILGDNGIITIAKKAKENTELAKIEEETELNELYTQLENNGGTSGGTIYDAIAKLKEFKTAIANAIGKAGGIKPDVSAETNVFENNINGIVKEVTKSATATAEDISSGKTAWVNGNEITGTGKSSENEGLTIPTLVTAGNGSPGGADLTLNTENYSKLTIDSISFAAYVIDSEVIIYGNDKSKILYQLIDTNRYDFRGKTYNDISIDVSGCNNISIHSFANATNTTGREITYKNITLK